MLNSHENHKDLKLLNTKYNLNYSKLLIKTDLSLIQILNQNIKTLNLLVIFHLKQ
jgi:hypothetical protein